MLLLLYMADHDGDGARAPRFDGEDISPTTERELRGWFSTGLAAEIFAVCGVGKNMQLSLLERTSLHANTLQAHLLR